MSFEDERAAIEQRFSIQWANLTPVKYDNIDFIPPETIYVELQIHSGKALTIATSGSSLLDRITGIIAIQIYAQTGTGTAAAKTLADTAATIFRHANFSGIQCRSAQINRKGEDHERFIYNVTIPFWRDETFAIN